MNSPGRFVGYNGDDNNSSGINDSQLVLSAGDGSSKVKVWTAGNKTTQVTMPKSYTPDACPQHLYVEGVDTGEAMLDLTLKNAGGTEVYRDKVKVTVFKADIDAKDAAQYAEYLTEKDEDNPGAIAALTSNPNKAYIKAWSSGVSNLTRTVSWTNGDKVVIKDAGTVKTSPITLVEGDGDKAYTVEALAAFAVEDSVIVTLTVKDPQDNTLGSDSVKIMAVKTDIDTDTDHNGSIEEADDPIEELEYGRLVPVNDDDDNANGTMDKDDSTSTQNENDLARVTLNYDPDTGVDGKKVTLEVPSGSGSEVVYVWSSSIRENRITLPKEYVIGTDTMPTEVWVEGITAGVTELDLVFKLANGSEITRDKIMLNVVRTDIDVDSDNNGSISSTDDLVEMSSPGKYVRYNNDDDDANAKEDREDLTTVNNENDLVAVNLDYEPDSGIDKTKIELSLLSGTDKVKLYGQDNKNNYIELPKTYVIGTDTLPNNPVYLEGIAPGEAVVGMTIKSENDAAIYQDKVKVSVYRADIDGKDALPNAAYLSEKDEDAPGVLVRDTGAQEKATLKVWSTTITGLTRSISWDNTDKVTVKDTSGTTQTNPISLVEGDGDKEYTVEATANFHGEDSVTVTLEAKNGSTVLSSDTLKLFIIKVDIDTDSDNDDQINDDDEEKEEQSPGKLAAHNDDDDNNNSTSDIEDSSVSDEDDLVKVTLSVKPETGLTGFRVVLDDPSTPTNKVKVWTSSTKGSGNQITLPKTYIMGTDTMPTTSDQFYVEGINTGATTLDLYVLTPNDVEVCRDKIKLTTVKLELSATPDTICAGGDNLDICKSTITAALTPAISGRTINFEITGNNLGKSVDNGTLNNASAVTNDEGKV